MFSKPLLAQIAGSTVIGIKAGRAKCRNTTTELIPRK